MAQDDMHVIMYKILAYLYDCMKKGVEPKRSMIAHDGGMFSIEYRYWARIVFELVDHGYVDGFVITKTWGPDIVVDMNYPVVTMEGVEFLQDNSKMRKALEFLKETKSALPFI